MLSISDTKEVRRAAAQAAGKAYGMVNRFDQIPKNHGLTTKEVLDWYLPVRMAAKEWAISNIEGIEIAFSGLAEFCGPVRTDRKPEPSQADLVREAISIVEAFFNAAVAEQSWDGNR